MDWDADISTLARTWMSLLGDFGPTVRAQSREVKGYMLDVDGGASKSYFSAGELRELATACNEVADWLDKRADEEPHV